MWLLGILLVILLLVSMARMEGARLPAIRRLPRRRLCPPGALFLNNFIEVKALYLELFNSLPSICVVTDIDVTRAFEYLKSNLGEEVVEVYQQSYLDYDSNETRFNVTILVLRDARIIELGSNYAEVLHGGSHFGFAKELVAALAEYRMTNGLEQAVNLVPVQVAGFMRQPEMN